MSNKKPTRDSQIEALATFLAGPSSDNFDKAFSEAAVAFYEIPRTRGNLLLIKDQILRNRAIELRTEGDRG